MVGDIKSKIKKGEVVVLTIPNQDYSKKIIEITKYLGSNSKAMFYVNLNKMYLPLTKTLTDAGINLNKFLFIDGITMQTNSRPEEVPNCIFVQSSSALTTLSLTINKVLDTKKFDTMLFDSLSTLLIYNKTEDVSKFVHHIVTKIRQSNITAVFTALEGDTQSQLLKELGMYVDKIEKL